MGEHNHLCNVTIPNLNSEYCNFGFLQMQQTGYCASWCMDCYNSPSKKCTFCADIFDESLKPNFIVLLLESKKRGNFDEHIFSDSLLSTKVFHSISKYYINYLPPEISSMELAPNRKRTFFGQRSTLKVATNIFESSNMCVLSKCLDFMLKNGFTNYSILIHGGSKELLHIASVCFEKGLTPSIVRRDQRILLLDITEISIRFLDSNLYLEESIDSLAKRISTKIHYFPLKYNKKKFYGYCGAIPTVEHFHFFEDSTVQRNNKTVFVKNLTYPWNMFENLMKCTQSIIEINIKASLEFVRMTFLCQKKLHDYLNPKIPKNKLSFIHPFDYPLFTKPSFAYRVFLIFCQSAKDIYMVKPPIQMSSSKMEIEYANYIQWKYSEMNFETGWSPYGQRKFLPYCIPDIFGNRTAFFFNGCVTHGHTDSNCPFMKNRATNLYKVDKKLANQKFLTKLEQLLLNCDEVDDCKVMWQCHWLKLKKEDPEVRFFMNEKFRCPPKARLNCRDAVRGGLNEVYGTFFSKEASIDLNCHYWDKNSEYPYVAMNNKFPTKDYKVSDIQFKIREYLTNVFYRY